jgi:RNA polymerase sigma factor (TIGR02999 family)
VVDQTIGALIHTADAGDGGAAEELFATLYRELHAMAERQLRRSSGEVTLGTTTLLHEAYLNIAAREGLRFPSRNRFFAYASRAMRGIVIDYVRRRGAKKRGGELRFSHDTAPEGDRRGDESLAQLGDALGTLEEVNPLLAELVDLHFFCGLSFTEIAELREVSERTVRRDWRKARLLLHRLLHET